MVETLKRIKIQRRCSSFIFSHFLFVLEYQVLGILKILVIHFLIPLEQAFLDQCIIMLKFQMHFLIKLLNKLFIWTFSDE